MNAYMNSYLNTDLKNIKDEVLTEMQNIKNTDAKSKDIKL